MRPVARAEPTAEVACFADRDTAQVRTDAEHDEPLGFLDAVGVGLRIAKGLDSVVNGVSFGLREEWGGSWLCTGMMEWKFGGS